MNQKILFKIIILISILSISAFTSAKFSLAGGSPTWTCEDCGGPAGSGFVDMDGNNICQYCFDREYGLGNRVWNDPLGVWTPPGFRGRGGGGFWRSGGGGGGSGACKGCH